MNGVRLKVKRERRRSNRNVRVMKADKMAKCLVGGICSGLVRGISGGLIRFSHYWTALALRTVRTGVTSPSEFYRIVSDIPPLFYWALIWTGAGSLKGFMSLLAAHVNRMCARTGDCFFCFYY